MPKLIYFLRPRHRLLPSIPPVCAHQPLLSPPGSDFICPRSIAALPRDSNRSEAEGRVCFFTRVFRRVDLLFPLPGPKRSRGRTIPSPRWVRGAVAALGWPPQVERGGACRYCRPGKAETIFYNNNFSSSSPQIINDAAFPARVRSAPP